MRLTILATAGLLMCLFTAPSIMADVIAVQSFETSGDTWTFTPTPDRYNTETTGDVEEVNGDEDVWTEIKEFTSEMLKMMLMPILFWETPIIYT